MFFSYVKYELKKYFKTKDVFLWLLLFPVALGFLFKIAFLGIWEENIFTAIPVAVVAEAENPAFEAVIDELSKGEEPFLEVNYTDMEDAEKKLEKEEIKGIFLVSDTISLTVAENSMTSTVLKSFADNYIHTENTIKDIANSSPDKVMSAVETLSGWNEAAAKETILAARESDPYVSYFYNLITMVCLFASMAGVRIAVENQANLSYAGARKECTAMPKLKRILASYFATFISSTVCSLISVSYIRFVLGVELGENLVPIYISTIFGSNLGLAIGFAIGAIGKFSESIKDGIATGVSLICCFLSGLMVNIIKGIIEQYAPIVNRINPASIIVDSFFAVAVFDDYSQYGFLILKMTVMSVMFIVLGIFLVRRKKYECI